MGTIVDVNTLGTVIRERAPTIDDFDVNITNDIIDNIITELKKNDYDAYRSEIEKLIPLLQLKKTNVLNPAATLKNVKTLNSIDVYNDGNAICVDLKGQAVKFNGGKRSRSKNAKSKSKSTQKKNKKGSKRQGKNKKNGGRSNKNNQ
jgi:hypothetical protein